MRPSRTDPSSGGRATDASNGHVNDIEVLDIHKSFGTSRVLRGLTVNFVAGAVTTLLGPSGTGKSVLLKHLVGLLVPDSGDIIVFGKNLRQLEFGEQLAMRTRFGLLFQDGALFGSMNLFDNVAYPLRKHTNKREDEIGELVMLRMREVGLERAAARLPNEVSGGMRKRAGFARALILNPEIVMFDEPDSGLDPVRTSLLNDLVLDVHSEHGGTYIVVTHNIPTARKVDRSRSCRHSVVDCR
jgi:phospholipid/cholesterol/gamma-HCH transport system ATP-binding protein